MKGKKGALRFIGGVAGKAKILVALLLVIQVILGVSSVLFALFLKDIINGAVEGDKNKLVTAIILFASMAGVQIVFRAAERYLREFTRSGLENKFKARLFGCIMSKEYADVMRTHSGEWMTRLTGDTVVVADGVTDILPGIAGTLVRLIGAVTMIVILEPRFLYLVIPCAVLVILFSTAFRKFMKTLHRRIQERDGSLRVFMQERLESMVVVRTFAVQNDCLLQADYYMGGHRKARMKRSNFSNFCNVAIALVIYGAYVMCAVYCGFGIMRGTITYGTFMAVLQLIGQVQAPMTSVSGYLPKYYAMLASAERLMEAESLPESSASKTMSLNEARERYYSEVNAFGLSGASFTYPADSDGETKPAVLDCADIRINKGEYVAFCGASGCGKSTVLKLLMSLYPLGGGHAYIECKEGALPLDSGWQKLFAYVPQGNRLMSGTVLEVVSLADKNAGGDEERINSALKVACADQFVSELERGVDTLLGEHGAGLSEGQMQRLAIARAIFSEHPVLMLDECTSALDEATERQLIENLKNIPDMTVLIVTHRPALLSICDKVYDFGEDGKVSLRGARGAKNGL